MTNKYDYKLAHLFQWRYQARIWSLPTLRLLWCVVCAVILFSFPCWPNLLKKFFCGFPELFIHNVLTSNSKIETVGRLPWLVPLWKFVVTTFTTLFVFTKRVIRDAGWDKLWPRSHDVVSQGRTLWADERLSEPEREPDWARESQREQEWARARAISAGLHKLQWCIRES